MEQALVQFSASMYYLETGSFEFIKSWSCSWMIYISKRSIIDVRSRLPFEFALYLKTGQPVAQHRHTRFCYFTSLTSKKVHMSRLVTKPTKWHVRPAKTPNSLGIRPVWSESSLSALRKLGSLATHWAHREDSDQTGLMPRLIWVFAGRTVILLVLSWGSSY